MVEFIAGILSSLSANLSNSPLSVIKENSKFNKLFKSVVSNEKAKCFAAVGKAESVKTTLVQCEVVFLSQFSISDIKITPIPLYSFLLTSICFASFKSLVVIKIAFISPSIAELNNKLLIIKRYLYFGLV